jgi:hypothetical protein
MGTRIYRRKPAAATGPTRGSPLENAFAGKWLRDCADLPFERNYVVPGWRDWAREKKALGLVTRAVPFRGDFAWPAARVCVEIQGATFVVGGHSTGPGIERDAIKNFTAQLSGWACLALTAGMLLHGNGELIWLPKLRQLILDRSR